MRKALLFLFAVCVFAGCGSLVNTSQTYSFSSNADPVKVSVSGLSCNTPCTLTLASGTTGSVKLLPVMGEREGFHTLSKFLRREIHIGTIVLDFLGNILPGAGLISTTIDASTGNLYEYAPKAYYLEMVEIGKRSINFRENTPENFIIRNIAILRTEAIVGGGIYTETLAQMLKTDQDRIIQTILYNKAL